VRIIRRTMPLKMLGDEPTVEPGRMSLAPTSLENSRGVFGVRVLRISQHMHHGLHLCSSEAAVA
jgi:hypothetical protein